jgi:CheY-like chemotaxis protein
MSRQVLVIDDSPTILKVVQLVLTKAGYAVRTALDGELGVAAARETRPDVILLDFVMPKMNGYQVCKALSETADLRDVPVVLMSAKGDQVGERFVKVMGIVDYITKPFSPEAITAVVGHTVTKYANGNGAAAAEAETGRVPTVDAASEPQPPPREDSTAPRAMPPVDRQRILEDLRDAVAEAVGSDDLLGDELTEKIRTRLSDDVLNRLLEELGASGPATSVTSTASTIGGSASDVVLQGVLAAVPLGEVLTLLQQQQQTGVLTIRSDGPRALDPQRPAASGEVTVEVFFRAGKVEFVGGDNLGEEFLLGRYLLSLELVPRAEFEQFLRAHNGATPMQTARGPVPLDQGKLFGQQLIDVGILSTTELKEALRRQACERIYEVLRWRGGRFSFRATRELGRLAEGATLGLSVEGILMEGFRRVDEWHLIERAIDDFDAVYLRNEAAVQQIERARLTREELAVLEAVNGKNNVKEIVRESRMSTFDVSKMLFRLLNIKLIRRRVAPVAV